MTITERDDLETALERVRDILERAKFIMQEVTEGFFEKHDSTTKEGKVAILYDFPRRRAFALTAEQLLHDVIAELPQPDWVSRLQADCGKGQNE